MNLLLAFLFASLLVGLASDRFERRTGLMIGALSVSVTVLYYFVRRLM